MCFMLEQALVEELDQMLLHLTGLLLEVSNYILYTFSVHVFNVHAVAPIDAPTISVDTEHSNRFNVFIGPLSDEYGPLRQAIQM